MESTNFFLEHFEIFAAAIACIYGLMQVLQKNAMWYFSILAALSYSYVYFTNGVYALMAMQVYLFIVGIYGLVQWTRTKRSAREAGIKKEIILKRPDKKVCICSAVAGVLVFLVLGTILKLTNDPAPYIDAYLTTVTAINTFLVSKQYLFTWYIWLLNDSMSIVFYIFMGMYPTAALFAVLTVLCVVGYLNWKRNGVLVD